MTTNESVMPPRLCKWCGASFEARRVDHKFCSRPCCQQAHKFSQKRLEQLVDERIALVLPELVRAEVVRLGRSDRKGRAEEVT